MKKTLLLSLLISITPAYAGEPVLSETSYGKVKFGDSLEHFEILLNDKAPEITDPDERFCRQISFRSYPKVVFMVEEGVVTRAESSAPIATSLGITVGTSFEAVKKKVPSVVIEPHKYDPDGHYLILKAPDGKSALVMEEAEGKVSTIRGGLEPSVEYVEGCL